MRQLVLGFVSGALAIGALSVAGSAATADVDAAFTAFWAAKNPQDAAKVIADIVKSGVSVTEAVKRLKEGRTYSANARTGVVRSSYTAHGKEFFYSVDVPT